MRHSPRDTEHLRRMAALFAAGLALFLLVRAALVPKDFDRDGHFRTGALAENMARPMAYAGREACETCHADVAETRAGSRHTIVGCEACHGALGKHASDPDSGKPVRPDPRTVCLVCHGQDRAKPKSFPQVNPETHAKGESCSVCHRPHHPERS